MKKWLLNGFLLLASIGIILRFKGITQNPPGFYVDEASIAENAYQIMSAGTDEWGIPYPIYFKAFGEYKNPLFIYSLALSFKIFGVSLATTRYTAALWGIATVIAVGFLSKTVMHSKLYGLIGALVIIFLPWHFYSSRIAFEAISLPFFFTVILIFIAKYEKKLQFIYLWAASVAAAAMFYSYTSARLLSPILFAAIMIIALKKTARKKLIILVCLYALLLLPAITWNHQTNGSLFVRLEQIKGSGIREHINTYTHQLSPNLWFISGDSNFRHTAQKGLVPISYLPFLLVGIISIAKKWKSPLNTLILVSLITAPIPASLTHTDPNALRMIHIIPVLIVIIVIGIQKCVNLKIKFKTFLLTLLFFGVVLEQALFFFTFNANFKGISSWWFDAPFVELIPKLSTLPEPIWIHHYLLNNSHQITHAFICHTNLNCQEKQLHFSENADEFIENATNIYFGNDCQKIKSEHSLSNGIENDEYCIYQ